MSLHSRAHEFGCNQEGVNDGIFVVSYKQGKLASIENCGFISKYMYLLYVHASTSLERQVESKYNVHAHVHNSAEKTIIMSQSQVDI